MIKYVQLIGLSVKKRLIVFSLSFSQPRRQSPRSSVGGIVGLWENAEENQPLIGCLIISLTHSLLKEMRAILIIQEAKYKLVYLTRLFIASLNYAYTVQSSKSLMIPPTEDRGLWQRDWSFSRYL